MEVVLVSCQAAKRFNLFLAVLAMLINIAWTQPVNAKLASEFLSLFDPRNLVSIEIMLSANDFGKIANEQPIGGTCNFGLDPKINRYTWHRADLRLTIDGKRNFSREFKGVGIKKRSFCGSYDNTKPSLGIRFDKFEETTGSLSKFDIGTSRINLGNSKQDLRLIRQCIGYYAFASVGIFSPYCTLVSVFRSSKGEAKQFVGVYVLTESVSEEFFDRRPHAGNVRNGSLYEFELPDDFKESTIGQLQIEWSSNDGEDFRFAAKSVLNKNADEMAHSISIPYLVEMLSTEIYLRHWDGFSNNRNNTFAFNLPSTKKGPISRTRFKFVPSGLDQILQGDKPLAAYRTAIPAQIAWKDNFLRYHLLHSLVTMSTNLDRGKMSGRVDELGSLAKKTWNAADPLLGDPALIEGHLATVRKRLAEAANMVREKYGAGIAKPSTSRLLNLVGREHGSCLLTDSSASEDVEAVHGSCSAIAPHWRFESVLLPKRFASLGFVRPALLFRIRAKNNCLTSNELDALGRRRLIASPCESGIEHQWFFLMKRGDVDFEIRSFVLEDACVHFSDTITTPNGSKGVYLAGCDANPKNRLRTVG
jgi:CotH kinase protein